MRGFPGLELPRCLADPWSRVATTQWPDVHSKRDLPKETFGSIGLAPKPPLGTERRLGSPKLGPRCDTSRFSDTNHDELPFCRCLHVTLPRSAWRRRGASSSPPRSLPSLPSLPTPAGCHRAPEDRGVGPRADRPDPFAMTKPSGLGAELKSADVDFGSAEPALPPSLARPNRAMGCPAIWHGSKSRSSLRHSRGMQGG